MNLKQSLYPTNSQRTFFIELDLIGINLCPALERELKSYDHCLFWDQVFVLRNPKYVLPFRVTTTASATSAADAAATCLQLVEIFFATQE